MGAFGDDYELLFTLPPDSTVPDGCTEIGRVVAGSGVAAVTPQQRAMTISQTDVPDAAPAHIDGMATLIASGLGSGLSPFAPGTVGSLLPHSAFAAWALPQRFIGGWGGAVCVAIWSAEEAGRRWGVVDHPAIVIDEVVGLWLAVLIPLTLIPLPIEHGVAVVRGVRPVPCF